jgi:hypothetical protein
MDKIDSNKIAENAAAPESVSQDGTTVKQHSLRDQIEADKYRRKANALSGNPARCLVRVRTIARGATD